MIKNTIFSLKYAKGYFLKMSRQAITTEGRNNAIKSIEILKNESSGYVLMVLKPVKEKTFKKYSFVKPLFETNLLSWYFCR